MNERQVEIRLIDSGLPRAFPQRVPAVSDITEFT